jgi:GH25 family lysozyme M1 (1,4-beta-N-acetylmuramidase)/uncharacterized protein YraI
MKLVKKFVCVAIVLLMLAISVPMTPNRADAAAVKIYGIDVSKWQANIDWAKVKAAGVKFAILRIGTTYGKDSYFEKNYTAARAQGIDVGVYFYNYSTTKSAIESDAQKVVTWLDGRQLEYPVYFDLEDNSLVSGFTNTDRTNMCIWFNTVIENGGYYAGVYTGYYWMNNYINASTLKARYPFWMARYLNSGTDSQDYSNLCGMWQYSSKGSVNGISGNVDMNVCYTDYPTYVKNHNLNHYTGGGTSTPLTGYYTVTATGLNVRSGDSTSYGILTTISNGTEVAVVGSNAAGTWVNIRYNGINGWCNVSYLAYRKAFPSVSISYDPNGLDAAVPSASSAEVFASYQLSSSVPAYGGYEFASWSVKRASDGAWQKSDGTWTTNASESLKTYAPSSSFSIDEFSLNSAATAETYTFFANWEYIAPIAMGFYTVTTNTSPLMVRSTDSTSGTILARAPKGSEVAVFGFNADASWARVMYEDTAGWCSMTYLTFKEAFGDMNVVYNMNGVQNVFCDGAVYKPFDTFTVEGDGITAEGYEFVCWTLTRASDGKVYCTDGTWKVSPSESEIMHFSPGDEFCLLYANLNRAVQSDTYTFTAVWNEVQLDIVLGDANGDGHVNVSDITLIKKFISGLVAESDILIVNSDANGDGKINVKDVSLIKRLIAVGTID